MKRKRLLFAFGFLVLTIVIAYSADQKRRAASDLDALLLGRNGVTMTRLTIDMQQRRVVCTDKEVLAYLASALQNSLGYPSGTGFFHRFTFEFSTGREYQVEGYIQGTEWMLVIPNAYPEQGRDPTHATSLSLTAPIPNRVREMFDFLNARYQEVSGEILILEPDQPIRYDYSASLDLEHRRR